jgi:hypothetical protein
MMMLLLATDDDVIGNLLLSAHLLFKVKAVNPKLGRVQGLRFS